MYMRPVVRLKWNLLGVRLLRQQTYVRNVTVAVCKANCFRISQRPSEVCIVRIMYCVCQQKPGEAQTTHVGQYRLRDHLGLYLFHDLDLELQELGIILLRQYVSNILAPSD